MLSVLICAEVNAAPIGKERAQLKAQQFMLQRGMLKVGNMPTQKEVKRATLTQGTPDYYVFNANDNGGFVVVAGDDRVDEVLGFVKGIAFDENAIPDNMKGWLDNIADEIAWLKMHPDYKLSHPALAASATKPELAPLLTCEWDQGAPYYNLCPKSGNNPCFTGCVATAMAMVMYYYKWPTQTLQTIPGYVTYTNNFNLSDLPIVEFDWENMRDIYRGNYSEVSATAVAELMLYAGQSVWMDYTPEGSGASQYYVASSLKKYFGYDQNMYDAERSDYSIAEWDDLIYNEIAEGRPVLYTGYSMSVGHAFVCDGYRNGYFHINWGWGGYLNNYFKLSILNPNSTEGAGAGSTPDGFPNGQSIVVGVQPPSDTSVAQPILPDLDALRVNGNTISVTYKNRSRKSITVTCALGVQNADGEWQELVQGKFSFGNGNSRKLYCSMPDFFTEPGTYKVFAICKEDGEDAEWHRIGLPYQYVEVRATDNDGAISYEGIAHPVLALNVESISPVGKFTSGINEMQVKLKNEGDEYNGTFAIYCGKNVNFSDNPNGYTTVALEENEEATVSIFYQATSIEDMVVHVYAMKDGSYTEIGTREFATYDLDISDKFVTFDPLVVRVVIHNYSEADYNGKLRAVIYKDNKKGGQLDKEQFIPAGGESEFVYDTFNLASNAVYKMRFQFQKGELDPTFVTIEDYVEINMQEVGIREMTTGETEVDLWMTPSGVRVSAPTTHVLYIHNGKKVIR